MNKAQDLRINNYVQFKDTKEICRIYQIEHRFKDTYRINDINNNNNIEPIPLTEEILLKCGFEKIGNNFEYDWLLIHTHIPTGEFHFLLNESKSGKLKVTNLKYIHQLQNLYFALTGDELKVNL